MTTFHARFFARLLFLLTLCLAVLVDPATAEARSRRAHAAHGQRVGHAKKKKSRGRHGRRHRQHRGRRHGINHVAHAARYLAAARRHPLHVGDVQTGKASWYGARYHGRVTSSGERFDKDALTAAHLSLPFGTRVLVRNLDNDSTVVVRITDRGPFGRGRILDVSEEAAEQLGFLSLGVTRVAMEVLPDDGALPCFDQDDLPRLTPIALERQPDTYYFLQAGAYRELAAAEAAVRVLLTEQPGIPVVISDETVDGQVLHRVLAGRFTDRSAAVLVRNRLQADGLPADVRQMALTEG